MKVFVIEEALLTSGISADMIFSPAVRFKNVHLWRIAGVKGYKFKTEWKANVIVMGANRKL